MKQKQIEKKNLYSRQEVLPPLPVLLLSTFASDMAKSYKYLQLKARKTKTKASRAKLRTLSLLKALA